MKNEAQLFLAVLNFFWEVYSLSLLKEVIVLKLTKYLRLNCSWNILNFPKIWGLFSNKNCSYKETECLLHVTFSLVIDCIVNRDNSFDTKRHSNCWISWDPFRPLSFPLDYLFFWRAERSRTSYKSSCLSVCLSDSTNGIFKVLLIYLTEWFEI